MALNAKDNHSGKQPVQENNKCKHRPRETKARTTPRISSCESRKDYNWTEEHDAGVAGLTMELRLLYKVVDHIVKVVWREYC